MSNLKARPHRNVLKSNLVVKVTSVASEGDMGEDGVSKEEREKQRKRKAAERLREINKRKKIERVSQTMLDISHPYYEYVLKILIFNLWYLN